jgi:16S rRNA (cytosine967-C5)-methyltransferase
VHVREDGYRQDRASQLVAEAVGARAGERIADTCAAPGGKATALAATGAAVFASDVRPGRLGLLTKNRRTLDRQGLHIVGADGRRLPWPDATFDRVLVDAPCSGLGALRRRPDARWRITADAVDRLVEVQRALVDEAHRVLRPGGTLVYSVCTLSNAESLGVDAHVEANHPELVPVPVVEAPWHRHGRGAIVLPHHAGTDGMCLYRYVRS